MSALGVVVIGRNEGPRIVACLRAAAGHPRVFVDSGSTDDSLALARAEGVDTLSLAPALAPAPPFTAARARNEGLAHLLALHPDLALVQFVDGDCVLLPSWLPLATRALDRAPEVVAVCGRRSEKEPQATLYNRLLDLEWDTPVGEAKAVGGDALVRVAALSAVGGFDPRLAAGEEPELCVRLRARGGRILRLDAGMTVHDGHMTRLSQWWLRNVRAGRAFAQGAALHGAPPERHCVRECASILAWGLGLPALAFGLAVPTRGASLALLFGFGVLFARITRHGLARGWPARHAVLYACATTAGKFPQLCGVLLYSLLSRSGTGRPKTWEQGSAPR